VQVVGPEGLNSLLAELSVSSAYAR
jgi:hypothetical protein